MRRAASFATLNVMVLASLPMPRTTPLPTGA